LSITGKPCILVPSPNVAEDHQTKNAMELVRKNAALIVRDSEAVEKLFPEAVATVQNYEVLEPLADHIKMFAKFHADEAIAEEVMQLIEKYVLS
jgi:UDP-N-acetylglucosamine--N-acetylmuramyl-(pentapeptide) pyrophosphoryl-undecaprenol N-acetylglucosamine transferase